MEHQELLFTNHVSEALSELLTGMQANRVFVLTDENTRREVLPRLSENAFVKDAAIIEIPAGDMNKNLDSLSHVWQELQKGGATRRSVMVNLGGGVVTDLGGFAAATFKRGMRFINVPTTLLSAVDAAVGGKTGVNFNGLKNEIGIFCEAQAVIISTSFFRTLPEHEVKSGYAEMLKHGLLSDEKTYKKLLAYDFGCSDGDELLSLLQESVEVKRRIVEQDPFEKGLRRALNLGHTIGHAFESFAMRRDRPVSHGYAVAWGLVVEAVLSKLVKGMDSEILYGLADYVYRHYGVFPITCDDYDELLELMRHDKKSESGEYNFTLIRRAGDVEVDCHLPEAEIRTALDIYRDLMHI